MSAKRYIPLAVGAALALGVALSTGVLAHGWGPGFGPHGMMGGAGYGARVTCPHVADMRGMRLHRHARLAAATCPRAGNFPARGAGPGGGPRNGTGPRALTGECPLVNQQTSEPAS